MIYIWPGVCTRNLPVSTFWRQSYGYRTDSRNLYDFLKYLLYTYFENRKSVARRHIVLALHNPCTCIFRRLRDDRAANARL